MSQFPNGAPNFYGYGPSYGGYGFGAPWLNQQVESEKLPAKPPQGVSEVMAEEYAWSQQSGPWGPYVGPGLMMGGAVLGAWGGAGFVAPLRGLYQTYRWMDLHPTLARVKANYEAAIVPQPVEFVAKNGDEQDPMLGFVKSVFTPQLVWKLKQGCMSAPSMGWQGWEVIWGRDGGKYVYDRFDELWPDGLRICKYQDGPLVGQFAGILPRSGNVDQRLTEQKSLVVNVNARNGNLYGWSYHEAAYEDWVTDNQVRVDEFKLRLKVSEVIPIMKYPPGTSDICAGPGQPVVKKNNFLVAQDMIQNLAQGGGVALQNVRYEQADIQRNPKLAEVGLWQLDFYDAGTLAPAITGYSDKHNELDKRLVRAWRQSERAVLESTGGASRADSETHGSSDDKQVEYLDACFVYQLQSLVDNLVIANGGKKGDVQIRNKPFFDSEQQAAQTVINTGLQSPVVAPSLQKMVDFDALAKKAGVPTIEGASWKSLMQQADQQAQEQHDAQIEQMKQPKVLPGAQPTPGQNGGGRMAKAPTGANN